MILVTYLVTYLYNYLVSMALLDCEVNLGQVRAGALGEAGGGHPRGRGHRSAAGPKTRKGGRFSESPWKTLRIPYRFSKLWPSMSHNW